MAGAEPLALLQAFRKSYWHLGITRILRGPVWLVDPLDDPRAAVVCRSIASRYRSRRLAFLSWLPALPDDPRRARTTEDRRCGKEVVRRSKDRWSTAHQKKK